jgi:hypothetical protein
LLLDPYNTLMLVEIYIFITYENPLIIYLIVFSLSIPPTRIHTPNFFIIIDRYFILLNIYDSTEPIYSTKTLNLNLVIS